MTEERSEYRNVEAMYEAVIAAAIRYRHAMRRYMVEQVEAIDSGMSLDELVLRNQEGFQVAVRAEEELFALLDSLEMMQAGVRSTEHQENGRM